MISHYECADCGDLGVEVKFYGEEEGKGKDAVAVVSYASHVYGDQFDSRVDGKEDFVR